MIHTNKKKRIKKLKKELRLLRTQVFRMEEARDQKITEHERDIYELYNRVSKLSLNGSTGQDSCLGRVKTCDLVEELRNREGVKVRNVSPYRDLTITAEGPAVVLVVAD